MLKYMMIPVLAGMCNLTAQSQISPLKIGDKMPDIFMGKFLEEPGKAIKFSDIKAKLIVLDFWNIHCTVCITDMPKMDSIEKTYNGSVKIFAITKNSEKEVHHLFERIKIKPPIFPFIVEDSAFNSLFPHDGDPLHVWINEKGIIVAITFDYNTNFETINKFLSGVDPHLSRRWDFGFDPDYNLISEQNSGLLNLASNYSVLFRGLDEYSSDSYIRIDSNFIQLTNATLFSLYSVAYNPQLYGFNINTLNLRRNNRILLEVKDKHSFFYPTNESEIANWIKKNLFSYELKFPIEMKDMKYKFMQQDLARYFPFHATIKEKVVKCLSLELTNISAEKELRAIDTGSAPILKVRANSLTIRNMPVSSFIAELIYSNPTLIMPIVDDTNFQFKINISLNCSLSDIKAVNKQLINYGLRLIEKEKAIDMLIISDE